MDIKIQGHHRWKAVFEHELSGNVVHHNGSFT